MNELIPKLLEAAKALPELPGVYLMKNADGKIIYVGKAKILKNRVTSYFTGVDNHYIKVRRMVHNVASFDYYVCSTEMEALVLECSQIKHYMPHYNILLKDDKNYPYVKVTLGEDYPRILFSRKRETDKSRYFGPYSGSVGTIVSTVQKTFKLPSCKRKFPEDIGKGRPCLNYSIKNCMGLCTGKISKEEYREIIHEAVEFLDGKYKEVMSKLEESMERAAEELRFEEAARLRDRRAALTSLGERQKVVAAPDVDRDVIALSSDSARSSVMVMYIRGGKLTGSDSFVVGAEEFENLADGMAAFVKQHYLLREDIPKEILFSDLPYDTALLEDYLTNRAGKRVHIRQPQRGEARKAMILAMNNAKEALFKASSREERVRRGVTELAKLCGMEDMPVRIEAIDISNTGSSEVVGGIIVFENGRPSKKDYKRFKIKTVDGQDDYESMREVIWRRFKRYKAGDSGFDVLPDLFLIDGGQGHLSAVTEVMHELGIYLPTFGMVKDDKHRTRGLVGAEGEITPSPLNPGFILLANIQEEVHRYAIAYHRKLRGKKTLTSSLTEIEGIGETRAATLLAHFKSMDGIRNATLEELAAVKGMNVAAAKAVKDHFGG